MPTHLPIPLAYYPRTEQDLATASERLGGQVSLHIGELVEKAVKVDGVPTTKRMASFVEWWLEYPAEFIPVAPPPPEPEDPQVRDLLVGMARIAAQGWAKEVKLAKGWPPESPPASPSGTAAPAPFLPVATRKGSK